jgi:esterase/lipase superfamily enzyme
MFKLQHRPRHHLRNGMMALLLVLSATIIAPAADSKSKFRLDRHEKDPATRTVFYATTRWNEGRRNDPLFGTKRHLDFGAGSIAYGTARVKRPDHLAPIERSADWFSYVNSMKANDTKWQTTTLGDLRDLDEAEMFSQIKDWTGTICVYIHGYDESFESSMRDAAVVSYEFDRRNGWENPTLPILFSWPSANKLSQYAEDEANVEWSAQAFTDFIDRLSREKNEAARIYVVGHSLGTRLVFALTNNHDLVERGAIDKLILSASDYDYFQAVQRLPKLESLVKEKIFVFSSDRDGPLITSHYLHGSPRLGRPFDAPKAATRLEDYMAKGAWDQLFNQLADIALPGGLNNPPEAAMWIARQPGIVCELGAKSKWIDVSELVSKDAGHRLAWPVIASLLTDDATLAPLTTIVVYKRPFETILQQNAGTPQALYRFHRISGSAYGTRSPNP